MTVPTGLIHNIKKKINCHKKSFYNDLYSKTVVLYGVRNDFVNLIIDSNTTEINKIKSNIIDFLDNKGISYNLVDDGNSDKICISFGNKDCKESFCSSSIIVLASNKDVYRVYPNEIIYIAIEKRKSVLYLTDDRRIETNYHLDHWKIVLDKRTFAQPHYSYIVNLNYVEEVTKELVTLGYNKDEYKVYTSSRKIGAFKKTFMNFKG